eukprot:4500071-Heterocapsa_arctica.AAC.1
MPAVRVAPADVSLLPAVRVSAPADVSLYSLDATRHGAARYGAIALGGTRHGAARHGAIALGGRRGASPRPGGDDPMPLVLWATS